MDKDEHAKYTLENWIWRLVFGPYPSLSFLGKFMLFKYDVKSLCINVLQRVLKCIQTINTCICLNWALGEIQLYLTMIFLVSNKILYLFEKQC